MPVELRRQRTCVDLYCGAGGTSFGAQQAGLKVVYGLDRDKNAVRTFAFNHPDSYADCRDVANVTGTEILRLGRVDHIDFLLSGPNCQAVSTMGLFYGGDPRNLLFVHLARLIDELIGLGTPPLNVLVENVPGLAFRRNIRLVQDLVRFFLDRGYQCAADVVNFANWGLPQLRHRFLLMASREGILPSFPSPCASVDTGAGLTTTWEAISDLSELAPVGLGEVIRDIRPSGVLSEYQRRMRGARLEVHNHHVGRTADIDLERIRHVRPGGSWKDIPPELMPERFRKVRMTDYKTLYGRLLPDHPAYTISASFANVTSGCFTHPIHNRPLTVREGCRLQGFPDDFVVVGTVQSQYRQIGNAVPALASGILIAHWIGLLEGKRDNGVAARLTEELLFAEGKVRLPLLTPRYRRLGYGSGTYWPKGWGEEPDQRPTSGSDYRISTDPIRYRRTNWRKNRDQLMRPWLGAAADLDLDSVRPLTAGTSAVAVELVHQSETADADEAVARRKFMEFLAPCAAIVNDISKAHRVVRVHCDFSFSADWLTKFLRLFATEQSASFSVFDSTHSGRVPPGRSGVFVTAGRTDFGTLRRRYDYLVLVCPFSRASSMGFALSSAREARAGVAMVSALDCTIEEAIAKLDASSQQGLLPLEVAS